jgi:hypothetical protein
VLRYAVTLQVCTRPKRCLLSLLICDLWWLDEQFRLGLLYCEDEGAATTRLTTASQLRRPEPSNGEVLQVLAVVIRDTRLSLPCRPFVNGGRQTQEPLQELAPVGTPSACQLTLRNSSTVLTTCSYVSCLHTGHCVLPANVW